MLKTNLLSATLISDKIVKAAETERDAFLAAQQIAAPPCRITTGALGATPFTRTLAMVAKVWCPHLVSSRTRLERHHHEQRRLLQRRLLPGRWGGVKKVPKARNSSGLLEPYAHSQAA
jgi:hypothetical protein